MNISSLAPNLAPAIVGTWRVTSCRGGPIGRMFRCHAPKPDDSVEVAGNGRFIVDSGDDEHVARYKIRAEGARLDVYSANPPSISRGLYRREGKRLVIALSVDDGDPPTGLDADEQTVLVEMSLVEA